MISSNKELIIIILGVAVCYAYYYFKEFKKKEEKRQDRLNRIKVDNDWFILYNTGQKEDN